MSCNTRTGKRNPEERPPAPRNAMAFTLFDASRISGLSQPTLRRRAAEGRLLLTRVGGRTLVVGDSLRALLGVEG